MVPAVRPGRSENSTALPGTLRGIECPLPSPPPPTPTPYLIRWLIPTNYCVIQGGKNRNCSQIINLSLSGQLLSQENLDQVGLSHCSEQLRPVSAFGSLSSDVY